jgi:S-adenosyl methyltransferase
VTTAKSERLLAETLGSERWRTRQEILDYFGDLKLVEPGLVPLAGWRPNPGAIRHPEEVNHSFLGGVARKE